MGTTHKLVARGTDGLLHRLADPVGLAVPMVSDNGTKPVWVEGGGGVGEGRPEAVGLTVYALPGLAVVAQSTASFNTGVLNYQALIVRETLTLTALVAEVTAGNGASRLVRGGLYEADPDWQPGALVADVEFDASTTGVKTTSASAILTPGRYLVAREVNDANVICRTWSTNPLWLTTGANGLVRGFQVSRSYGALDDPGLAWTTILSGAATLTTHAVALAVDP